MSLTACFARDCEPIEGEHHKLYYFPNDLERREKWIRFCGKETAPSNYHGVCRRHFQDEDFLPSHRLLGTDENKWRLLRTAVPSLNGPELEVEFYEEEEEEDTLEIKEEEVVQEEEMVVEVDEVTDPMQLCRLCLAPLQDSDDNARNILDPETNLTRNVKEFFQLVIEDAPNWPAVACGECVEGFQQIVKFKRQIITTHEFLHSLIVPRPNEVTAIAEDSPAEKAPTSKTLLALLPDYPKDVRQKMLLFGQRMKLLSCRTCKREFASFEEQARHVDTHHQSFSCCGVPMVLGKRALDHLRMHVDDNGTDCVVCKEEFDGNFEALYDHIYAKHRTLKLPLRCKECGKIKRDKQKMRAHLMTHLPVADRPNACPHCPKRFAYKPNMVRHIRRMHDVKVRNVCDACGKGFSDVGNLYDHRKKCTGEKVSVDGKRKNSTSRRRLEADTKKPEDMTDPVSCPVCEQTVDRADMRWHSLKHVDKPNKYLYCDVCMVRILGSGTWTAHMAEHRGEKFRCHHCPAEFKHQATMYSHMRAKHPEERERSRKR